MVGMGQGDVGKAYELSHGMTGNAIQEFAKVEFLWEYA